MLSRLIFIKLYIKSMFPYNDAENAWISGNKSPIPKARYINHSFILSVSVALVTALFSTLLPTLIYFSRQNIL